MRSDTPPTSPKLAGVANAWPPEGAGRCAGSDRDRDEAETSSMATISFQGITTSLIGVWRCRLVEVLPMFPDYRGTYVPGLYPALPNVR